MCKKLNLQNENYQEYYWLRKKLYDKSKYMKFGYGQLPKKFTEGICNELYEMSTVSKREGADSRDKNGKMVEIKSTQGDGTSVSINKELNFDYLIWIHFDYENNKICIQKCKKSEINSVIKKLSEAERKKNRPTIDLGKVGKWYFKECYEFEKEEAKDN